MGILLKQDKYIRYSDERVNAQLCNLLEKLEFAPGYRLLRIDLKKD